MQVELQDGGGDIVAIGIVLVAVLIGVAIHWVSWRIAIRVVMRTDVRLDEYVVQRTRNPMRLLVVLAAVLVSTILMGEEAADFVRRVVIFIGIIALGWLAVSLTLVGQIWPPIAFLTTSTSSRPGRSAPSSPCCSGSARSSSGCWQWRSRC